MASKDIASLRGNPEVSGLNLAAQKNDEGASVSRFPPFFDPTPYPHSLVLIAYQRACMGFGVYVALIPLCKRIS